MVNEDQASRTIRVLLVEDHLLTRIGLRTVLERTEDIKIVGEAENGEEAIAKVEELAPDVVLMDVGMPVMDGIEALSFIHRKYTKVHTIMLTSHDSEADILASLAAGACGYCLKDVAPERLYTAIRSVCSGDVWLDSSVASLILKNYANLFRGIDGSFSNNQPESSIEPSAAGFRRKISGRQNQLSIAGSAMENNTSEHIAGKDCRVLEPLPDPLSRREMEVLGLLVDGLSNQEIANKLFITLATVKTHVRNILNKLAVDDRTQAAVQAMRRGIV